MSTQNLTSVVPNPSSSPSSPPTSPTLSERFSAYGDKISAFENKMQGKYDDYNKAKKPIKIGFSKFITIFFTILLIIILILAGLMMTKAKDMRSNYKNDCDKSKSLEKGIVLLGATIGILVASILLNIYYIYKTFKATEQTISENSENTYAFLRTQFFMFSLSIILLGASYDQLKDVIDDKTSFTGDMKYLNGGLLATGLFILLVLLFWGLSYKGVFNRNIREDKK